MKRLIDKKKRGEALTEAEIQSWISRLSEQSDNLPADRVPAYQTTAMLMAIRLMGMTSAETTALTKAMADSGDRLRFPGYPFLADKHSTGGVGDKVTLILAPLMAACNMPVTMLSGRGLGHTGGTIDKFEALSGVQCERDNRAMNDMLATFGWANAQTTPGICPADRVLYRLRDVTATVDSIPLITASIMSKKIAGGATHLCLDVKCGPAAFMETLDQAKALAENLQTVGQLAGLSVQGLITRMDEPLGHAIGNYLELMESVAYLRNEADTPLMDVVLALGRCMLRQTGMCDSDSQADVLMDRALAEGRALDKLLAYLQFNGADAAVIEQLLAARYEQFPRRAVTAINSGYVANVQGRDLGHLMVQIGAGRETIDQAIDPYAGVVLNKHCGDAIAAGDTLCWVYGDQAQTVGDDFLQSIRNCYQITTEAKPKGSVVLAQF